MTLKYEDPAEALKALLAVVEIVVDVADIDPEETYIAVKVNGQSVWGKSLQEVIDAAKATLDA